MWGSCKFTGERSLALREASWVFAALLACIFFFAFPNDVFAASRYWVGGSDGANVNDTANWSDSSGNACGAGGGASVPGGSDVATFNTECDNGATIDLNWSVLGVDINTGYTGTITQSGSITIGSSNYDQADGVFTGSSATIDINDGSFTLSNGTFTNSSGGMTIERNFTISGGTYTDSGTVTFDSAGGYSDATIITYSGTVPGTVDFNKSSGDPRLTITIAVGTTIDLGDDPNNTACGGITNNGTITLSGTWKLALSDVDLVNAGTIQNNGTNWDGWDISKTSVGGGITNNSGKTITYDGTAITCEGDFTQNGTFDFTGVTITFDGSNYRHDSTISGTFTNAIIDFNKTDVAANLTIATDTTIDLGDDPNNRADGGITNNGTITLSGTWTLALTTVDLVNAGTIQNNGTNWDGWDINSDGAGLDNNSGKTITYDGTAITCQGDFTQNGIFDLTGVTITFDGSYYKDDSTIAGTTAIEGNVIINKSDNGSNTTLGSNVTIQGDFTRTNGPITNPASAYTLSVQGDVSISTTDTIGGANFTLAFGGTGTSTLTQNAGTIAGPLVIDKKSSGSATLLTAVSTSSTCTASGGIFALSGSNLTCGSTFTVSGGSTLELYGSETSTEPVFNTGATVLFTGDGDSASDTYVITDLATQYAHLTINSTDADTDTFQTNATLTASGNLTLTSGIFDVATNDNNINILGDATMDNEQVDMGDGTWSITDGTFDTVDVTTFDDGSSTLLFEGTCTWLHKANANIWNVTVATGATVTATVGTKSIYGLLDIAGSFSCSSAYTYIYAGMTVRSTGSVSGSRLMLKAGTVTNEDGGSWTVAATTSNAVMGGLIITPGTYLGTFTIRSDQNGRGLRLSAGDYTFNNVVFATGVSDRLDLDCFTNAVGTINIQGNLTLFSGSAGSVRVLCTGQAVVWNLQGDVLEGIGGTLTWTPGTGTITLSGSTQQYIDFNGLSVEDIYVNKSSGDVSLTGNLGTPSLNVLAGTFNANGSTLTSSGIVIQGGTLNGGTGSLRADGPLSLTGGTFSQGSNPLTVTGNVLLATGTTFTKSTNSSPLVLAGDLTLEDEIGTRTLGVLQIGSSPDAVTLSGSIIVDTLNISQGDSLNTEGYSVVVGSGGITNSGTLTTSGGAGGTSTVATSSGVTNHGTFNAGDSNLTLSGSFTNPGTLNSGTGTITFDGDALQNISGTNTFYNLTVANTAATPSDSVDVDADAITVSNTLTISDGQFQPATSSSFKDITISANGILKPDSSASITASGSWTNNGTFTPNSGTITFNGSSAQTITTDTFYNLIIANAHASPSDSNDVDAAATTVTNNLTITDGQFQPATASDFVNIDITANGILKPDASSSLTVSGDLENSGTFTHNSSAITLDGTSQTLSGSTTFYDLTKTVASADTLTFDAVDIYTIENDTTLEGAAGNLLSLISSSEGTQWEIDPAPSTRTISYVDVKDSKNNNPTAINCVDQNCTDSGNNTNWTFTAGGGGHSAKLRRARLGGAGGNTRSEGTFSSTQAPSLSDVGIATEPTSYESLSTSHILTPEERTQEQQEIGRKTTLAREIILARFTENMELSRKEEKESEVFKELTKEKLPESDAERKLLRAQVKTRVHASAQPRSSISQIAQRRGLLAAMVDDIEVLYRDVPTTSWFAPFVASLIEEDIAQGYKDEQGELTGEFGVSNPVTRAEILKMSLEAANTAALPSSLLGSLLQRAVPRNPSAKGTWASSYVAKAEELSISTFPISVDVHEPATRGEVVQTLLEVMGIPVGLQQPASYVDIPTNHPYANAIAVATFYALIEGDTDSSGNPTGTFRPDEPINRAEVSKIIALAKELLK